MTRCQAIAGAMLALATILFSFAAPGQVLRGIRSTACQQRIFVDVQGKPRCFVRYGQPGQRWGPWHEGYCPSLREVRRGYTDSIPNDEWPKRIDQAKARRILARWLRNLPDRCFESEYLDTTKRGYRGAGRALAITRRGREGGLIQ